LAYFNFNYKDLVKQKYSDLIHLLIEQLSWHSTSIPTTLWDLYSQVEASSQDPMPEALLTILKELCRSFTHTYLILDALDACVGTEWSPHMHFIETLMGWGFDKLHLLVTSQMHLEIEHHFKYLSSVEFDLGVCINGDIQIYIHHVLVEDESFKHWWNKKKLLIEEALVNGANGL